MSPYLSKTFPVMTEEENRLFVRHAGSFRVSYFDDVVGMQATSCYRSVEFFLDKAGLPDTPEEKNRIYSLIAPRGFFELVLDNGRRVGIYA
jgi:hypothetical protein